MDEQVTCASCGTLFLAEIGTCPACGALYDTTQATRLMVPDQPLLGPGEQRVWMPSRVALLVVFIAPTASEFLMPPPPRRNPTAPWSSATATFPAEATAAGTTVVAEPTSSPAPARSKGGGALTVPPQPTATLPPPVAETATATLVIPTPTQTKDPGQG